MTTSQMPFFPESASDHAFQVDCLFLGLLVMSVALVVLLAFLILYCVVRYRVGSKADRTPPRLSPRRLEIAWTILPMLVFTGLFAWGASLYLDRGPTGSNAMDVYVVARQWMWEVRYPDGRREHNRLHLPMDQPVRLHLTSEDVIHSFYVPALRVKQDVVPGRYVTLSFTPNRAGTYPLYCAEYCGTKHSAMTGSVTMMAAADYQRWLGDGGPLVSMAAEGQVLFGEKGCAGCHSPSASVHAPMLEGIYGRSLPLQGGGFARADDRYIRDSILLPLKEVTAGYEPVMPSYQGQLNETEILALVEYIKSFKTAPIPRPSTMERARPAPLEMRERSQ